MLNRFRDIVCDELVAQLLEARRERGQPIDLLALERQVSPQKIVVSSRQRRDAQVGNAVYPPSRPANGVQASTNVPSGSAVAVSR